MSATLDDVVRVMLSQEQKQDNTTSAIDDLTSVFRKKFLKDDRGAGDRLEDSRESRGKGSGAFDLGKLMVIPGLDELNNSIKGLVLMGANLARMLTGVGLALSLIHI